MSKKDLLGSGASFSSARRPSERSERGRAKAVTEGEIPAYELVKLPLTQVCPTPLNPRSNFGSEEDLTRFGEELRQVQLAACVAVSRGAYLALWPEHGPQIGAAAFVLVNGERRYRSALTVGLERLDFVVRDDLARTREDFVDHLLAENLDREDFDVIERARGVHQLVVVCAEGEGREHGSKSRAAERLGKSPSWVTRQLALLELPSEIQVMMSAGEISERDARVLVSSIKASPGLSTTGLLALLQLSKDEEQREKARQKEILRNAQQRTPDASALTDPTPAADTVAPAGRATEQPRLLPGGKSQEHLDGRQTGAPTPVADTVAPAGEATEQPRLLPAGKSQEHLDGRHVADLSTEPAPGTQSLPALAAPPESATPEAHGPVATVLPTRTVHEALPAQGSPAASTATNEDPWSSPETVFHLIQQNMGPQDRLKLTEMLLDSNRGS
ncbi:ParB/RepB/Spo0J family partition protein [Streptomyces sp. MB09-01]|uniref:ParB/RepB/Spo0J family partition protein n=1 Tax=Streptomyces sp. MB09-01 TaxID=3028666 RepID=UPI0029A3E700|nr:ParB/RepB/Spo0J family partition protein [Streptomyces sp. MB09-01]MDX3538916.1 ParB/RepB/Spo0J family partition protein [Streptomyces sp. MB09-01]